MPLDNTDYQKKFMDLYDLLPDVYKSDTNRSLFYNLFNRFLSKQDVKKVAGYIGHPNTDAILRRQIEEPTLHRQAYQLQPIINALIGSVQHFSSWKDIENEIERLGVEIDRMNEWGSVKLFNWAPPVDIDKLINYENYYWTGGLDTEPDYITIRSRCAVATSRVNFWTEIFDEYGSTHPIVSVLPYTEATNFPVYTVIQIDGPESKVTVDGKVTDYLDDNDHFYLTQTNGSDGKHRINSITYDRIADVTTILAVPGTLNEFAVENGGTLTAKFYDKIGINGNLTGLYTDGFIFFISESSNYDLNSSFWKVVGDSIYDEITNQTVITLNAIITDSASDGNASLEEQYRFALAENVCFCDQDSPWDILLWDDNPDEPLWGGKDPGNHAEWLQMVSQNSPPPANKNANDYPQWYYVDDDILYQWSDVREQWNVSIRGFSLLLDQTVGFSYWDYIEPCGGAAKLESADQWINSNKWLHRSDLTNIAEAKRAQHPIIEFEWDLQLNEWTYVDFNWKYRNGDSAYFNSTDTQPILLELKPIDLWEIDLNASNILTLDERFGDLTDIFVPGFQFRSLNTDDTYECTNSVYARDDEDFHFRTKITISVLVSITSLSSGNLSTGVPSSTPLTPLYTTHGDKWQGYGIHWLFDGYNEAIPTGRPPKNLLAEPDEKVTETDDPSGEFSYIITPYLQKIFLRIDDYSKPIELLDNSFDGSTRTLRRKALVGQNDVRVYLNGVQQYGNYDELGEIGNDGLEYVYGIQFVDTRLNFSDEIVIEVGEASQLDMGLYNIPVRIHESNQDYTKNGDMNISLVHYRRVLQNKALINQYPIFDIYTLEGRRANKANHLFGYRVDAEYPVNGAIGKRIVYDSSTGIYEFEQLLIEEDNGPMWAYRNFSNLENNYWFKPDTNEFFFWEDETWTDKTIMGNIYQEAYISPDEPGYNEKTIDGFYWYDTGNEVLKKRDTYSETWEEIDDVKISYNDHTLQTIWKEGTDDDLYVPGKVDWDARSQSEYDEAKDSYVSRTARDLMIADPSLSQEEADEQATEVWYGKESNANSPSGEWVGDWEIPEPLYFNHMHENRKVLSTTELRGHFNSIILNQKAIPGYSGSLADMFRLIPLNDVNYGVGGFIHEYNDGFDTFLSSAFVKNVTPISLIEFSVGQYDVLLTNSIIDKYRENLVDYLTNIGAEASNDMTQFIIDNIIDEHWENDYFNFVYGDSTTYNEDTNTGMRNWIATLPYINLMKAVEPMKLIDKRSGVSELKHHDGHYKTYKIGETEEVSAIQRLIHSHDRRTVNDTWGKESVLPAPNNAAEFEQFFATDPTNRHGVYWYYKPAPDYTQLFRFNVVHAGTNRPINDYEDGALWFDTSDGQEVLRIKRSSSTGFALWDVVDGLAVGDGRFHNGTDPNDILTSTISAWETFDLNELLIDVLLDVETRLYENAPDLPIRYSVEDTRNLDPVRFDDYLYDAFLDYITVKEIINPFANLEYQTDDPWTWNYRYSVPGGGHDIVYSDDEEHSFHISGNYESLFDPCWTDAFCPSETPFYIKNSRVNDGSWKTLLSTGESAVAEYVPGEDITIIKVEGMVSPSIEGFIYQGVLPGSFNDGSESGGYWKSYYQQLYGTPYPNLEPWILQGYTDKPDWWDEEYEINLTDISQWGARRWKYKHGFEIKEIDNEGAKGIFRIDGEYLSSFAPGESIDVDRSESNDGTHIIEFIDSVAGVNHSDKYIDIYEDRDDYYTPGRIISVYSFQNEYIGTYTIDGSQYQGPPDYVTRIWFKEELSSKVASSSRITSLYDPNTNLSEIYFNQNVNEITDPTMMGRIAKAIGMWENIRIGAIPPGKLYPNGITSITGNPNLDRQQGVDIDNLQHWEYFSINIDNVAHSADGEVTNYYADDLFPPYWDQNAAFDNELISTLDATVRSVFVDYGTEIKSPGANYSFGENGPVEYEWRASVDFLYDQLKASYRLDPVRYVCHTFGINFYDVGGLQADSRTDNTFAHIRTNFHGDIVGNAALEFSGTNQWYVNYNRFLGFDSNFSDFANLWKSWTAPLTYQFATFVDTPSFEVGHRRINLTDFDRSIHMKKSEGVQDFWMDAFKISLIDIPPDIARYDNQSEWSMLVNSHLTVSRRIKHYDVQNYQFFADPDTDICTLNTWEILTVDVYNRLFEVSGNQSGIFENGIEFEVTDSFGNDGNYTTYAANFNQPTNSTIIEVQESIGSSIDDGLITIQNYRTIPWQTGEVVYTSTTETLPSPLFPISAAGGLQQTFIIKLSDTEFQLARTSKEALNGTFIDITSKGRGNQFVGKIHSTFKALNGQRTATNWIHYAPDKERVIESTLPLRVQGMQSLVDLIDGYDIYVREEGWRINDNGTEFDSNTGTTVSWQTEIEKFINYAYGNRQQRYSVKDRYAITVDPDTDEFSFETSNPAFKTGDKLTFLSSTQIYPEPIYRYLVYYFIYLDGKRFKIATTKRDAERGRAVDILTDASVSELFLTKPKDIRSVYPTSGINPFRSDIWFRPPYGVISNALTGPTEDIRTVQTVVNQYGQRFDSNELRVFREDKRTQISVKDEIPNLIDPPVYYFYPSDNDYIHISGIHLFVDTYEHVLVFNNYTKNGDLLYDPFLGVNADKFEMLFNRQPEFTQRPNVGGYYFHNQNNLKSDLIQNMEHGVESLRYAYDTFQILESNKLAQEVRNSLGYKGIKDYLSLMNANAKSQFIFWRGFIRHKGAINSVKSFLNSKRIVDAKVDEFWAFKIGEFGSAKEQEYPEMYLNINDVRSNDALFTFEDFYTPPTDPTDPTNPALPTITCGMVKDTEAFSSPIPGTTSFTLANFTYAIDNLNVYVNGVKLNPTQYSQDSDSTFVLASPIMSQSDLVEAETWNTNALLHIVKKYNIFTNVSGEREFTLDFDCPIGNLSVYLNGSKLTASDFFHTKVNEFGLFESVIYDDDIIEAETWIPITIGVETKKISEIHSASFSQREFRLTTPTNLDCGLRNLDLSINGEKMTIFDYSQTDTDKFTLIDPILSDTDAVETETWTLSITS